MKVTHAKWILELYNYLCHQNEILLNGFKAASIREAVKSANKGFKGLKGSRED